ncbi:YggS family pyridoxal phosphate-dependent enzyme [Cryomorpha ignava]|uniref:Pyridoxal phosphate homeostasis protein n=1 Tax=Cryomorpha ignava TaxID=101383 RepID=A0A7K3WVM9_9FLAO|nr:YggS family pyridoxal phosphate-dependent enzyme [Cryomorpha ignava]NEN24982.1 YggS family pyridoxal phosphate-dependent enzyme [Cryomorpha ignava]
MSISENLKHIKSQLGEGVTLVAVSKYSTNEEIQEAYDAGHRDFGENKAQDLEVKKDKLPNDIRWHFIGHLQRNKAKYITDFIHLVHAVDSFKLLREINKQAKKSNRTIPCLLQMHIAAEDTKFGMDESEIENLIADPKLTELQNVKVVGLMGMATNTDDSAKVNSEFKQLKNLFEKLKAATLPGNVNMEKLSMGMSQDYEIALENGSTMVRVGTAVFKS